MGDGEQAEGLDRVVGVLRHPFRQAGAQRPATPRPPPHRDAAAAGGAPVGHAAVLGGGGPRQAAPVRRPAAPGAGRRVPGPDRPRLGEHRLRGRPRRDAAHLRAGREVPDARGTAGVGGVQPDVRLQEGALLHGWRKLASHETRHE